MSENRIITIGLVIGDFLINEATGIVDWYVSAPRGSCRTSLERQFGIAKSLVMAGKDFVERRSAVQTVEED